MFSGNLTVFTLMPVGTAPQVNVILIFGQVVTIPIKALLANWVKACWNVTVKVPLDAAVTCEQGPKLFGFIAGPTPLIHANDIRNDEINCKQMCKYKKQCEQVLFKLLTIALYIFTHM